MRLIPLLFYLLQGSTPAGASRPSWINDDSLKAIAVAILLVLVVVGCGWLKRVIRKQRKDSYQRLFEAGPIRIKSPPLQPQDRNKNPTGPLSKRPQPQPAKDPDAAPAIFISYRRDDSSDVTGRIYDRLIQRFGKHSVFKDVDNIPLGVDFREHLADSVGRCDVLLTIIGRQWLSGDLGQRRLDDARDFVRIEIEAALQRKIPVIPVLVQAAPVPRPDDLPETLKSLVFRHGMPVRTDPDFHQDMDRLIRGIEGYLKKRNQLG